MKRIIFYKYRFLKLLVAAALAAACLPAAAQSYTMVNGDTLFINGCAQNTGYIYDDGGPSGSYSDNFEGWVVIQASAGSTITLNGSYVTESPSYDWFDIWDGNSTTGTVLGNRLGGTGTMNLTATSGTMTIRFRTDGSGVRNGFELRYNVDGGNIPEGVMGLAVASVSQTSATLQWSSTNAGPFKVYIDGLLSGTTSTTSYTVSGLAAATTHNAVVYPQNMAGNHCAYGRVTFRTACGTTIMPIVENYDDVADGAMPPCWTSSTNFDDAATMPQVTAFDDGNHAQMLSCGNSNSSGHFGMVVSPAVTNSSQQWTISFDYRMSHNTTTYILIGLCDSTSTEQQSFGFTQLDILYASNNNQWNHYRREFNVPSGKCRIAFRMEQSQQNGAGRMVYIDNLGVEMCGIDDAWITRTDTSSAVVNWTTIGTPTVSIGIRHTGAAVDDTIISPATSPQMITGLQPGSDYSLTLYPMCNGALGLPRVLEIQTLPAENLRASICETPSNPSVYPYELNEGWRMSDVVYADYSYVRMYTGGRLISPPIASLGDKDVRFLYYSDNYWNANNDYIVVGTMTYADDSSTFTPIDTIDDLEYSVWKETAVHIPAGCNDRFVAFLAATTNNCYILINNVSIGSCQMGNARIERLYGTRAVVAWDYPSGTDDTVIVEYYPNWNQDYRRYDTVVGATQHTITGLTPNYYYDFKFHRPCGEACDLFRNENRTPIRDYDLPLCEDFDTNNIPLFDSWYGWYRNNMSYGCPDKNSEHSHSSTNSIKMLANNYYDYDLILPYIDGLGGQTVTFWAMGTALASRLEIYRWDGVAREQRYYHLIDTVAIVGDGEWHHYHVTLPANITGRVTLRYNLSGSTSGVYFLWLDDVQIGDHGYGDFTFANLTSHSVDVVWQNLGGTGATVKLVSENGDVIYGTGAPDTLHFDNLDSNTLYYCYIACINGSDTLCYSYAGKFHTPYYSPGGSAAGISTCNTFDDLPAGTLPTGWTASENTAVTIDNGVMSIAAGATVTLPEVTASALYIGARGMSSDDTLFVGSDTTVLDTVWRYYCYEPPTTGSIALRVASGAATGGCRLQSVGFSGCPIVDFTPAGNTIICTVRGGVESEYILTLTDEEGEVRSYHVYGSSFTIEGLPPSTDFTASWRCLYNYDGCMPTVSVRTAAIPLPYCVDFADANTNTLPEGWRVEEREGDITQSNSSNMEFYSSYNSSYYPEYHITNSHWQYIILPEVENYNNLSVKIYAGIVNSLQRVEVGVLTDADDTSTFVAGGTLRYKGNQWYDYVVDLSVLPHGRVAIRNMAGRFDLRKIQLMDAPGISYHLYRYDTLTIEAASAGAYQLDYKFTSDRWDGNFTNPNVVNIDTTIYRFPAYTSSNSNHYLGLKQTDTAGASGCWEADFLPFHKPASVPYCEDFETYQWDYGYLYFYRYSNRYWDYLGRSSESSSYEHFLYYGTDYRYFLSFPYMLVDSVNMLTASFKYNCRYSNDYTYSTPPLLIAGVLPDALDTTGFVAVDTLRLESDNQWHTATVDFSNYHGDGHWIALLDPSNNGYHYVYLDDIHIEQCHAAMQATASIERYNVVRIDNVADESFYVEYGPSGFARGSGILQAVTSTPYYLTLSPETEYDFYFYCDSTGVPCAVPQTVTTLALPLTVPTCIDFDSCTLGVMPRGWTSVSSNPVVSDSVSHSGNNALMVLGTINSPDINIDSLQQVAVGLWVMTTDANTRLVVGTVTNPADAASFHPMKTIVPEQPGVWEHHYVSLANAPTNAHFIALRNTAGNSRTLFVDNIGITTCAAFDLHVDHVDNNSIDISWNEIGSPTVTLTVDDNGTTTTHTLVGGTHTLPITPLHGYTLVMHAECTLDASCNVPYNDTVHIIAPVEGMGCVNPTDLQSPQAVFFSGTYQNPYSVAGAVDYGSNSPDSRHTVCYDTTERDPRTGYMLRTIPEGYTSSVRLGNWSTDALTPEAEGVIYSLYVDTFSFNLLMLRYAAVLQDPMHAPIDQPRFRLELLDSAFNVMDPVCGVADFIANRNLGWNEAADNVLWKDWTPVGIDMASYAGQHIYVRLTTYDCNEGSHYGYAYFTLECMRKSIDSETCGAVDSNRFTAPAGFDYRWYTATSSTTISTNRTIMVPTADMATYYCDLSFVGNSACSFTLSAYGGPRLPLARCDTVVDYSNCQFDVQFINQSTISSDGINPTPTDEQVETAFWDFGNGETSNNYHARTVYHTPGTYNVTLIIGISGGACTDTLVWPMTLDFPTHPHIVGPDTLCYGDSAVLTLVDGVPTGEHSWLTDGSQWYLPLNTTTYNLGSNTYTLQTTDQWSCTPQVEHHLTVNPIYRHMDTVRICTPLLPYSYTDTTFLEGTTSAQYNLDLLTTEGCDSSYHLWLTVSDTDVNTAHDTVNASICDNESFLFFGTGYTDAGEHVSVHVDATGFCDSIHTLMLDVRPTSATDTMADVCDNFRWYGINYTTDTATTHTMPNIVNCDSVTTLHLTVRHSTDTTISHYVLENDLPYVWNGITFHNDTTAFHLKLSNSVGCDSNITFNLTVYLNQDTVVSQSLCEGNLPYMWNGVNFSINEVNPVTNIITHQATLVSSQGADSVVTMQLRVLYNSTATIRDTLLHNALNTFTPPLPVPVAYTQNENDSVLVTLVDTVMVVTNAVGCDSTVHYCLSIYRNYLTLDTVVLCDNQLPTAYLDTTLTTTDSIATFSITRPSVHGADSVIRVTLRVHPTYEVGDTIIICPNKPAIYEGIDYGGPVDFDSPHLSVHGCDSLVHVSLQPRDTLFRLSPLVSLDTHIWHPYDTTLLGCAPQPIWLNDTSNSVSREWSIWPVSLSDDTTVGTNNIYDTVLPIGIYSFRLIAVGAEGCVDTIQNDSAVYIFQRPTADFTWVPDIVPFHDPQLDLMTEATPADSLTYSWLVPLTPGGGQYDTLANNDQNEGRWHYAWEALTDSGQYEVLLVAYWLHNVGDSLSVHCTDTARHPVIIVNTFLQFPNLVTPNGDGINDTWEVVNLVDCGQYPTNEVWIYNQWGALVFHAKNIASHDKTWNPNDTNSPDGTYFFRFSGKGRYGVVKQNGVIEVLR